MTKLCPTIRATRPDDENFARPLGGRVRLISPAIRAGPRVLFLFLFHRSDSLMIFASSPGLGVTPSDPLGMPETTPSKHVLPSSDDVFECGCIECSRDHETVAPALDDNGIQELQEYLQTAITVDEEIQELYQAQEPDATAQGSQRPPGYENGVMVIEKAGKIDKRELTEARPPPNDTLKRRITEIWCIDTSASCSCPPRLHRALTPAFYWHRNRRRRALGMVASRRSSHPHLSPTPTPSPSPSPSLSLTIRQQGSRLRPRLNLCRL